MSEQEDANWLEYELANTRDRGSDQVLGPPDFEPAEEYTLLGQFHEQCVDEQYQEFQMKSAMFDA